MAWTILGGIETIHAQIVGELRDDEADDRFRRQGFTFGALFDEESGKCKLIELNTFEGKKECMWLVPFSMASRSTCALWNQLDDAGAEFRVAV